MKGEGRESKGGENKCRKKCKIRREWLGKSLGPFLYFYSKLNCIYENQVTQKKGRRKK